MKTNFFYILAQLVSSKGPFLVMEWVSEKKRSLLIFEISQQDTEVERSSRQPIPLFLQILSHLLCLHLLCFLRDLIRSSTPSLFLLELPLCRLVNKTKRSRAERRKLGPKNLPLRLIHCSPQPPQQSNGADLPPPPPPPRRNVSVFNSPTSPLPDNERWTSSFAFQPKSP